MCRNTKMTCETSFESWEIQLSWVVLVFKFACGGEGPERLELRFLFSAFHSLSSSLGLASSPRLEALIVWSILSGIVNLLLLGRLLWRAAKPARVKRD